MAPRLIVDMSVEEERYYKERAARGREEFKRRNDRIKREQEERNYKELLARMRAEVDAHQRRVAWDWFLRWFCCGSV
jgi:hypothetical protein